MTCIGAVRPSVGSQGVWEAPLSNMREPSKLAHVLTHIEMIIFLCTLSKQLMGSYLDLTLWSSGCSKPTLIWGLWGSLRWCTADPRRRSSNLLTCKHLRAQTQVSAPFCSALGWWLSSQMPLVSQSTLLSGASAGREPWKSPGWWRRVTVLGRSADQSPWVYLGPSRMPRLSRQLAPWLFHVGKIICQRSVCGVSLNV